MEDGLIPTTEPHGARLARPGSALGGTYYRGSRVTVNGNTSLIELGNSRVGAVLAWPVDRNHSLKFSLSDGLQTRTGSDFTAFGLAWQYRWGAGY